MPYRIKNWATYQHYSDKRAPWIKLYPDVARDYEFRTLPERVQLRLIFLWMAAPCFKRSVEDEPVLPDKPAALSLAAAIEISQKDLDRMVSSGFLIRETNSRDSLDQGYGEGEGEGEGETEGEREKRGARASVEDVDAYILERGYSGFTGQQFVDYYTANGWRVGRSPMKDWRAAVRNWWSREQKQRKSTFGGVAAVHDPQRPCQHCGAAWPCAIHAASPDKEA